MSKFILMTLAGFEKLERELEQLKTGERAEATQLLQESQGNEEGTASLPVKNKPPLIEYNIQEI